MTKNAVIFALVVIVGAFGYLFLKGKTSDDKTPESQDENDLIKEQDEVSPQTRYFINTLNTEAVARVGQPIEGFEPFMYMEAFPGLVAEDFDGVEALLGRYEVASSRIIFQSTVEPGEPVHSAERAINTDGMNTLLDNISNRLNFIPESDEAIDELIKELLIGNGETSAPIEKEFDGKIIYSSRMVEDTNILRQDCDARGGIFNECGSPCAPEVEVCAAVCAYTCEF